MKKDLKKIQLVSRTPKVVLKPKEPIVEYVPEPTPLKITEELKMESNPQYDHYIFLKDCIRDIIYYIMHATKDDINKILYSIEVNNFIKEYKFDKEVHRKIRDDIKPIFYPMLNSSSNYFSKYFIKDLPTIIDEVMNEFVLENLKDKGYEKLILNELHNFVNYRKTTIKILPKSSFDTLHNIFLDIKEEYTEQFILGKKRFYSKEDFNLDPYTILKDDVLYKIVYVVPKIEYKKQKNQKLSKVNPRGLIAPVIFGLDDKPVVTKVWNSVAEINNKYKVEIPLKCLVPIDCRIKDNKVIKMSNKELVKCFSNLKMFKDKLNKKISLILFSITETYYSRRSL